MSHVADRPSIGASAAPAQSSGKAWLLALLLTACLTLAYVDRAVLNLLAEPIKRDLALSDTRLSLLQGFAFTISFVAATLPAGWLADRMDRRVLISVGVLAWSLMTAACGLAETFTQLFWARVGVGVFEAVLTPCAVVMLAAAFRPGPRATALGVYHMGTVVGVGLSLIAGGLIMESLTAQGSFSLPVVGELRPWQGTFVLLALPGIVLAAVFFLFARDPGRVAERTTGGVAPETMRAFFRRRGRLFAAHLTGMTLLVAAVAAGTAWAPIFLVRDWGMTPGEIARTFGPISIVCGIAGTFAGGLLASFLARRGRTDAALLATLVAILGATIFGILVFQTTEGALGYFALAGITFFSPMPLGVSLAVLSEIAPPGLRGRLTAIYIFTLNAVGQTVGPLAVGLSNDVIFRSEQALTTSLSLLWVICGSLAALVLFSARKGYREAAAEDAT